jgi:hypothetical protein
MSFFDEETFQQDQDHNPFLHRKRHRSHSERHRSASDRFISVIPQDQQIQYRIDCKLQTPTKGTLFHSYPTPPASSGKERRRTLSKRTLFKSPELILDAPSLRNDFYSTLLDWSCLGTVVVALDHEAFVWNQVSPIN